eukprot:6206378-Amphidinium_carterae.1
MLSTVQVFEEERKDLVELVEGIVLTGIVDGVTVEPLVCSASARCLGFVRRGECVEYTGCSKYSVNVVVVDVHHGVVDKVDRVVGVVGVDGVDGASTAQRK